MFKKNEKIIMISNIGSASRKYSVYAYNKKDNISRELFSIAFDHKEYYPEIDLKDAFFAFFKIAKEKYNFSISDIDIIAERVVAVGEFFLEDKVIDKEYLEKLEFAKKYDVLHTESLINELKQIFELREVCKRKNIAYKFELIGISDSTFHSTISKETYTYAVKSIGKNIFRKYGYHGISMSEISNRYSKKYKNIIAIHLGGGGSVSAIKNGKSIFNSFGMTPLSGLINLTRSGDVDPFIVFDILEKKTKNFSLLEKVNSNIINTANQLYEESGLYFLSKKKDMRDIVSGLDSKNKEDRENCNFALDVYINKINEYIGVALSHLEKIDAIVLTGAILEKSEIFRKRFLKKISWLNLKKDNILIAKTEEEKEMLRLIIDKKLYK